jgi:serine phosphatase RsbU (regulator of sigma subunit)
VTTLINQKGEEMVQSTIWLPRHLHQLVKSDRLNLSGFVRDQLEELFSDRVVVDRLNEKFRLMQKAKEARGRQRALVEEEEENRERCLERVRQKRERRQALEEEQEEHTRNLEEAWETLVDQEEILVDRLERQLPENDPHGDHVDFWPALARQLSAVNGDTFDEYEVIAYAKSVSRR